MWSIATLLSYLLMNSKQMPSAGSLLETPNSLSGLSQPAIVAFYRAYVAMHAVPQKSAQDKRVDHLERLATSWFQGGPDNDSVNTPGGPQRASSSASAMYRQAFGPNFCTKWHQDRPGQHCCWPEQCLQHTTRCQAYGFFSY